MFNLVGNLERIIVDGEEITIDLKELKNYNIKINTMSPGPCKTEMFPKNKLSTKLSIPTVKYLSSLSNNGPSGEFFWFMKKINIISDLSYIDWSNPNFFKRK